ncbi:MAG: type IV secretory system conjugative DNA transfer family protein [Candidatus Bipolaricaulia bacterium]
MSKHHQTPERTPRRSLGLEWRELLFNTTLTPAQVTGVLERLATARDLGVIGLELHADETSLRWLIGVEPHRVDTLKQILATHLPARVLKPRRVRPGAEQVAKLRLTGRGLTTSTEKVTATIRALYGTLTSLAGSEQVTVQLLLGHRIAPAGWHRVNAPSWLDLLLHTPQRKPHTPAVRDWAGDEHGFHATIRVGVSDSPPPRLRKLISQIGGVLRGLETSHTSLTLERERPEHLTHVHLPWRWPLHLHTSELAVLTTWPIGDPPLPIFGTAHPRLLVPSQELQTSERVIGVLAAPGRDEEVSIPIADAAFHTHLLGPTGSGKSTVMLNLIEADLRAGRGVFLIDPKGDLTTDVFARVPASRHRDVVVIDPTSASPVGFNPLDTGGRDPSVTADTLLGIFESLFKENWGIRTADVLSAAFLTLARTPDANLLWLHPLLTNPGFRKKVLQAGQDPLGTDAFWRQYDAKKSEAQAVEIAPVLNKVRQLILRPGLRAVLGQSSPRFDISDLFTKRRIVIVNLNRGLLGNDAAKLLGTLLLGQLWSRLLARQALPARQRHIVGIYIDEVHDFIAGLPGDLSDALAQARSLGAGFVLAHQYRSQLSPAMVQAVEANTRNKIYFGMNGVDASATAKLIPELDQQDLMLLPKYHAYANVMQSGDSTGWVAIRTLPPNRELQDPIDIYAASHATYGVDAARTEQELISLIGDQAPPGKTSAAEADGGVVGRVKR